jgi:hypothetical protein
VLTVRVPTCTIVFSCRQSGSEKGTCRIHACSSLEIEGMEGAMEGELEGEERAAIERVGLQH